MLNLMRKHATSWMIKFLLGAIVVVFIFWGVGSFRLQRANVVAMVNGEPVTLEQYRESYNNLLEQVRRQFGTALNEEMIKMLQLKEQALNRLIDQRVLLGEAGKLNLQIPEEELASEIRTIPAFQNNGNFDSRFYRNVLNQLKMTPEEFETAHKDALLAQKVRSLVTDGLMVSDQEAQEWYKWFNASVNLDYVMFDPERYTEVDATPEETQAYFESNKENYKTEPKVKSRYLHFDPEKYKNEIRITDEEIKEYYEDHREEFRNPKTVEARHILMKLDANSSPEEVEKARTKALEVMKMAREGKDFAELAKEHSEGPGKETGGYLGTFRKEAMIKPFSDQAFSMEAGEISEPVRTQFGWHIIKVEKVNEETDLALAEAEPKIREKLSGEKAKILAYDEAEAVFNASYKGDDLVKAAEERKLEMKTTDFFTRKGPETGFKNPVGFAAAAFSLDSMEISDILDLEDGYYLLQVTEKMPETIPDLEAVREKVRQDLIQEKQEQKAKEEAEKLLAAVKNGGDLTAEAEKLGIKSAATGFFKRSESIPNIGFESSILESAFTLSGEKRLPEEALKGAKGYYVIRFAERKDPDTEGFEKEKDQIKGKLLEQKKQQTFQAWLTQVKEKSEITIENELL